MGVSPAIFESAGQRTEHYVPGSYSRSSNVSSPSGVTAGNLVVLGKSTGGEPFKLLEFSGLADAQEVLVGDELLRAVGYAFNGSNTYIPQKVFAMRVNDGTQSSLDLISGSTTVLKLKSWDWGLHTNQLKLMLNNGTTKGVKLSVAYKDDLFVTDNIYRDSLSIQYVGDGVSANITVGETNISLSATDSESVTIDDYTFNFDDFPTLDELATRINDTGKYSVTVLDIADGVLSKHLDTNPYVTTSESSTMVLTSNLQALADVLNQNQLIGEVEVATTTRQLPDVDNEYKYFTGGTSGNYENAEWIKALEQLETENVQLITTYSTDAGIQALIANHCTRMSSTENRKERTAILGCAIGESDDDAIQRAIGFNNKLVAYVCDNAIANNPINGKVETISGGMLAVMLSGMESAMAINEPLTNKSLNVLGFTKKRTIANMGNMIKNGLIVCNPNPENVAENVCIRAVTTFQGNNDLISCEKSMVREDLYMNRDLRNRYSIGIGRPNESSTSSIIQTLKDAAREWALAGYIVPKNGDNVWNIKVKISGDKVYLTFSRYLTAPRNFVFITATNHVYESTVEV